MQSAHTEEFEGFTINLELLPEDVQPDWDFESEEDRAETLRKIDAGVWLWFCAKVTASKHGIVLATDYLGACCYESADDFVTGSVYYEDMRRTVVDEARRAITALATV